MNQYHIKGLTDAEVLDARKKFGPNKLQYKRESGLVDAVKSLAKEPMVILLLVASGIYFISGEIGDGLFLVAAILIVAAISLFQDSRSRNALKKLQYYTQPVCKAIRNGNTVEIISEDLVVGDYLQVEEGTLITADGEIIHSNDFSVNESILTGESLTVFKDSTKSDHSIYAGTTVSSGLAIAKIIAVGNGTKLGKIGKSLEGIANEETPLEKQINNFVVKMAIAGALIFLIVWGIHYLKSYLLLDSLLKALTLAMSILPEEIPVAFATFMALGAWRLMKIGIVVKQMKTVETLGSATVICTDKTGTLTENRMSVAKLYALGHEPTVEDESSQENTDMKLVRMAMWASEPIPFDPMEVAIHQYYQKGVENDERPHYKLIHEYPLSGKPPMMTHVFESKDGKRIIAAKGAPEALIAVSALSEIELQNINQAITDMAAKGYRVLGVGFSEFKGYEFPATQQELSFKMLGIIAFFDPPKKNIPKVLSDFYRAGIAVKIITGDNAETTGAIARQVGIMGYEKSISGDELMKLNDTELSEKVMDTTLFTRMFPEAKLKIIETLKQAGQIVAMTGDGVNDGPALKSAHIGIAMGRKGTEIAKQAASLILQDDDLSAMVNAIAMGRKIYSNLKKAIRYIISIHIPIILTVFIPLALGWVYPNIFSPIHIIFLELIMGPTCSIIYENEPIEKNTMQQNPKQMTHSFFNLKELSVSILQGLMITVATLFVYKYSVSEGNNIAITRTMVFIVLVVANIFLTLINRSFYYSILNTLKYKNHMVPFIILITLLISGLLIYIKPFALFFEFEALNTRQLWICSFAGFASVIWFELVKYFYRLRQKPA